MEALDLAREEQPDLILMDIRLRLGRPQADGPGARQLSHSPASRRNACAASQEVRVEVSDDGGRTYRQILVQEYNFSPRGATYQREEQRLDLPRVTHLRLTIVPNKSGSGTASLTALRLFA